MASSFYTLYPGDVIFLGTPEGVSPIEPGDRILATIQSIGSMTVAVTHSVLEPKSAVFATLTQRRRTRAGTGNT